MNVVFYVSAVVAVLATLMVITRAVAAHALLYLIVSLLAVALVFYTLGAPFVAALEVIVYAGAIMVLFLFVIMLLNFGPQAVSEQQAWFRPRAWAGPGILTIILLVELLYTLAGRGAPAAAAGAASTAVQAAGVGLALYGRYLLGVEMASMLLLAGLVGAYHLAGPRAGEIAVEEANAAAAADAAASAVAERHV